MRSMVIQGRDAVSKAGRMDLLPFLHAQEIRLLTDSLPVNAWGGEIFVLDMGEPVKIDTLARNRIRLSGYRPDVDTSHGELEQ